MQVRSAASSGGNVATQGAAAQASFRGAASGTNPYGGRQLRQKGAGGGQLMNQPRGAMQTGGSVASPAHGNGIDSVARSMNGSQPVNDTRPDRVAIDRAAARYTPGNSSATERNSNVIDNISARYTPGSMVGDHTTPPALRKYLD
jgi:hypothetical protein